MVDFLSSGFFMGISPLNGSPTARITVNTYEGNPYYLYATGNPLNGWGAPAVSFTGATGTSQTTVTVSNYLQPGPVLWRAKQGF